MLIAITGGIGSGKSVVSRVLTAMGYDVYDCDGRARELIDGSREILGEIASRISADVVSEEWLLDRRALAAIVFADGEKLAVLNEITHGAVRRDLAAWRAAHDEAVKPVFVETAILYESGLDRMADRVWEVVAPTEVRIARAMLRDGADRESVERRIAAQASERSGRHSDVKLIVNDGFKAVLPQVLGLLQLN